MDRLVELFVQSAREGGNASGEIDAEAIERGMYTIEKMLTSQDGLAMSGGNPAGTFVCLGMALEEKPKLGAAAVKCYERAIAFLGKRVGTWEHIVVLQQLGAVCVREKRLREADKWLSECAVLCEEAEGHPRQAVLFNGNFSTQQTRSEFASMVERLRAKTCLDLGDEARARAHVAESKRLHDEATGDAVERVAAKEPARSGSQAKATAPPADTIKALWAEEPKEERRVTEYSFLDEGPTVLLLIDLNQHLGIGEEASTAVDSLRQFRVQCEENAVDVQLRLRRRSGDVCQFRLLLQPLRRDIVPEDTVPRLRGKETKRRLEVRLFKRDKDEKWTGDFVKEGVPKLKGEAPEAKKNAAPPAPAKELAKGTLLNPLSAEELARLPRPSGSVGDNRPGTFKETVDPEPARLAAPASEVSAATPAKSPASPSPQAVADASGGGKRPDWPSWVADVEKCDSGEGVDMLVRVDERIGDIGMKDLELDADAAAGVLCLKLLRSESPDAGVLKVSAPAGTDIAALSARWRRKQRVLQLTLPRCH